ncbi:MAG: phosphoenolpyruvate--protein phosphotransferase [bacterium]
MYTRRRVIKGVSISSGIVLGQARVVMPGAIEVVARRVPASRVKAEVAALEQAIEQTIDDLRSLRDSTIKQISGRVAKIFDAQLLIAGDYEFLKTVKAEIAGQHHNASFIYQSLINQTTAKLKKSSDTYLRQMAIDIEAVASRVLSHLAGHEESDTKFAPQTILVGKTFSPNDIVSYRKRKAIGFLVSEGGSDSHMALIARSLMVPVVLADDIWQQTPNNCRLILDGISGQVIVHPSDEDWDEFQKRKKRLGPTTITRIKRLPRIPPVTRDDCEVVVAANLTLPGPADDILAARGIPIGLYRTEFLYLAHGRFPDEKTQYSYYRQVAEKFAHASVVLRTFDLGYDKSMSNSKWPREDNPALGWRGIRAMLDMSQLFKTQIRAILRASVHGNLKILLPMISQVAELEKARKLIAQVKFQLRKEGVDFDRNIEIGIMVEVPAAAMIADRLAAGVDFMSIGTNDLTQYTLAADRTNRKVADLYSPYHPSVLQLIGMTVTACLKAKRSVSICGEMAGDVLALPLFIGMGVNMLSMSPARIFDLCRATEKIDSRLAQHLVATILTSGSAGEVISKLENYRIAVDRRKQ